MRLPLLRCDQGPARCLCVPAAVTSRSRSRELDSAGYTPKKDVRASLDAPRHSLQCSSGHCKPSFHRGESSFEVVCDKLVNPEAAELSSAHSSVSLPSKPASWTCAGKTRKDKMAEELTHPDILIQRRIQLEGSA